MSDGKEPYKKLQDWLNKNLIRPVTDAVGGGIAKANKYINSRSTSDKPELVPQAWVANASAKNLQQPNDKTSVPPPPATEEQIALYIQLKLEQARQQAEAPWRTCFEQNAPVCQQLLGLLRAQTANLPEQAKEILAGSRGLTKQGFLVHAQPTPSVNEPALRNTCTGLTQVEMEDSITLLRHTLHSIPLDFRALVTAMGEALCNVRAASALDDAALRKALTALNSTLEQHGVLACFSDHEEIMNDRELLIRCFTDAAPGKGEIPGLFYRSARGLACIGRFGGESRAAQDA